MTSANAPLLSDHLMALYERFALYEAGVYLSAEEVRGLGHLLLVLAGHGRRLEQARRERDELMAIARDMDAIGLVQVGQLGPRVMGPIIDDAVAALPRNVVRFPRPHRQHVVISEQGGGL
ncbi:MAG TPA: hypothetical protein VLA00_14725 [Xanthobacteraceae bacterium]|nr:hypothetical protein [Xanthobacteraceae bacterium]